MEKAIWFFQSHKGTAYHVRWSKSFAEILPRESFGWLECKDISKKTGFPTSCTVFPELHHGIPAPKCLLQRLMLPNRHGSDSGSNFFFFPGVVPEFLSSLGCQCWGWKNTLSCTSVIMWFWRTTWYCLEVDLFMWPCFFISLESHQPLLCHHLLVCLFKNCEIHSTVLKNSNMLAWLRHMNEN